MAIARELRLRASKKLAVDNLEAARGAMMRAPPWSASGAVRVSRLLDGDEEP